MNREIMERLSEHYRLQRAQNAREEERRLREVCEKDGQLAQLIDERREMILGFCKSAVLNPKAEPPQEQMRRYNREIRERLRLGGFPEDYLEPVYRCQKCRDTGLMGEEERVQCDCARQILLSLADTVGTQEESFEHFDLNLFPETVPEGMEITQRAEMRIIRDLCEAYADRFPAQRPQDLLLYGNSGLGKSYLLCCIARRLSEKGNSVQLVSAYDVIRRMRDAFFGREDDTAELYQADLLLIDDLGMEPMMENITLEQLFHLISVRRSRRLPMVISTNLTMKELKARYSERIASRLLDSTLCRVVPLKGEDVRLARQRAKSVEEADR